MKTRPAQRRHHSSSTALKPFRGQGMFANMPRKSLRKGLELAAAAPFPPSLSLRFFFSVPFFSAPFFSPPQWIYAAESYSLGQADTDHFHIP